MWRACVALAWLRKPSDAQRGSPLLRLQLFLLLLSPVWLHDALAERALRRESVVSAAKQPQVRRIMCSAGGKGPDVIDLKVSGALTTHPIPSHKRASAGIPDEHFIPHAIWNVS